MAAQFFVYVDMGGGSTDIAIKAEHGERSELVYLTSVSYAGSALLDAYGGRVDPQTGRPVGAWLAMNTPKEKLRRSIRMAESARQVLGDPSLFPPSKVRTTEYRTRHFYFYLTEYIARLLA